MAYKKYSQFTQSLDSEIDTDHPKIYEEAQRYLHYMVKQRLINIMDDTFYRGLFTVNISRHNNKIELILNNIRNGDETYYCYELVPFDKPKIVNWNIPE